MAIDRTAAAKLFDEQMRTEIVGVTTRASTAMSSFRTLPMSNKKDRMPVVSALPTAGFLAAEGDAKPESSVSWDDVFITAEEIAVIVPIDDSVLADASIDVAGQVRDLIGQAFANVIDQAVFFGTGAPASWPTGGVFGAVQAGDKITETSGSNATAPEDWFAAFQAVEARAEDVRAIWGSRKIKGGLRNPIIAGQAAPVAGLSTDSVFGVAPQYPLGWDDSLATGALAILGDPAAGLIGVRQDMTFSFSSEATLATFGSLWQKDATAIRAVMRLGFVLAKPINVETGTADLPFSAIIASA